MLHLKVAYFFMHRYDFFVGTSYIFVNELVYLSHVGTLLMHLSGDVVFSSSFLLLLAFSLLLCCDAVVFWIFGTPSLTHTPLSSV